MMWRLLLVAVLLLWLAGETSCQLGALLDELSEEGQDDALAQHDPNLINPQNRQGYGRDVPTQIRKTSPDADKKGSGGGGTGGGASGESKVAVCKDCDMGTMAEQTQQAVLQFGVLIAVSLLVGVLFFIHVGIEIMLSKITDHMSKCFGSKVADLESAENAAALVGTFKRYK